MNWHKSTCWLTFFLMIPGHLMVITMFIHFLPSYLAFLVIWCCIYVNMRSFVMMKIWTADCHWHLLVTQSCFYFHSTITCCLTKQFCCCWGPVDGFVAYIFACKLLYSCTAKDCYKFYQIVPNLEILRILKIVLLKSCHSSITEQNAAACWPDRLRKAKWKDRSRKIYMHWKRQCIQAMI